MKLRGSRFFIISIVVALLILFFAFTVFENLWIRIGITIALIAAILKVNGFLDTAEEEPTAGKEPTAGSGRERSARYTVEKAKKKRRKTGRRKRRRSR